MPTRSDVGLSHGIVGWRCAACEIEVDSEVQRRLRSRDTEALDQIPAVRDPPPSQAAVQKDQALSLSVFKVVECHGRITTLTPGHMSI